LGEHIRGFEVAYKAREPDQISAEHSKHGRLFDSLLSVLSEPVVKENDRPASLTTVLSGYVSL